MNYLLDSNTIIDFVNNALPHTARQTITATKPSLSFVTRIEVLAWPLLSVAEENSLLQFINRSTVYGVQESVILQTISIRKLYKVKLPDALIAATGIVNHLTLLSRNLKDFKKIPGLIVIDPYTL